MKLPNLQNTDKTLWAIYISMIVVAVIALFSASSMLVYKDHSVLGPVGQQILFIVAGVVGFSDTISTVVHYPYRRICTAIAFRDISMVSIGAA